MNKYYLIALLLFPLFSIAQTNYKSGYVINLKGDTTRGYIDYKEWGNNPKNISFKRTLKNKPQRLGLNNINYFEINGMTSYQKYKVNISLNAIDISSPPSILDTASLTDTIFLKILQKGKNATLYIYRDNLKNRFYIKDKDADAPTELIYGVYQNSDNSINVVEKNTFRNQLYQLLTKYKLDSDKLSRQIQQLNYKEDDIIAIISRINGINNIQRASRSGSHPNFRTFVGLSLNSSTLKYSDGSPFPGSVPSKSNMPQITMGVDLFANPDIGHLIFRGEVSYKQSSYSVTENYNAENAVVPEVTSQNLKQSTFSFTPQIIYNIYNASSFKFFIDLGYALNISTYPTNQFTDKTITGVTTQNNFPAMRGFWSSFQLKSGIVISKRLEIYGAYSPSASTTSYVNYSANVTAYQVGLNYFFGKKQ